MKIFHNNKIIFEKVNNNITKINDFKNINVKIKLTIIIIKYFKINKSNNPFLKNIIYILKKINQKYNLSYKIKLKI